jgi:SnoaL-like domain
MSQTETSTHLDRWHKIVYQRDLQDLQGMLDENVVFYSPYAWKPYHGRQAAWMILSTVSEIFQDFTYHRELIVGNDWALEFSARVGDRSVKGIDLIRLNDEGRIVEFEVFIRPANGLQALGEAMRQRLGMSPSA